MSEPIRKAMKSVDLKDGNSGDVEAVFATLDVIDHDGDVLRKSAFTDGAPVVISAYGHRSHFGDLPLGKGRIVMTDTEAKMVGRFFLDTTHGRDAFTTIKNLSDDDQLQEWSFSLRDVESHTEQVGGRDANVITRVSVKEVSPVLEGAGIDTRTLVAKTEAWNTANTTNGIMQSSSAGTMTFTPVTPGARFVEQANIVAAALGHLADRAGEVVTMRAAKGKGLSPETLTVLGRLDLEASRLRSLVAAPPAADGWSPLAAMLAIAEIDVVG